MTLVSAFGVRLEVADVAEAQAMLAGPGGWRVDGRLPGKWMTRLSRGAEMLEVEGDASQFGTETGWRVIGREHRIDPGWRDVASR